MTALKHDRHDAISAALEGIKARPVAVVAGQLSRTVSPERRQVLEVELIEARRAAALRDQLVTVANQRHDRTVTEGVTDPVTGALAKAFGLSEPQCSSIS